MSAQQPLSYSDVEVGIFTALPLEAEAARGIFDETYEENHEWTDGTRQQGIPTDWISYTVGKIGRHIAVLTYMPGMGKVNAASVGSSFRERFPRAHLVLLLGICGAVPSGPNETDILLGDIIIGEAILQHDFGKQYPNSFVRNDSRATPSPNIRSFLSKLKARNQDIQAKTSSILNSLDKLSGLEHNRYPGADQDRLFAADYLHQHHSQDYGSHVCGCGKDEICSVAKSSSCEQLGCDPRMTIRDASQVRPDHKPLIQFGSIASGDAVIKSGNHRDQIASNGDVIAFDMESAGIQDLSCCLVVKAVSDYADSHKNNTWQRFAAAASSSCAKAILELWNQQNKQESDAGGNHWYNHASKVGQEVETFNGNATFHIS